MTGRQIFEIAMHKETLGHPRNSGICVRKLGKGTASDQTC
jgi:hypothetical protein